MRKKLLILAVPAIFYAQSLSTLIDIAMENNNIIKSKLMIEKSKIEDIQSVQSGYYPTVDIGGFYQSVNEKTPMRAGDTYSGYAKIGISLYDGGGRSNQIKQNEALLSSSKYDTKAYKKSLTLMIIQDFYTIKSIEAHLIALREKDIQLKVELQRITKFYNAGIATKDDIENLQAAYSNNIYQIDSTKFQILSLKKLFALKTGVQLTTLDDSFIKEPIGLQKELNNRIELLKQNAKSLDYASNSINSAYLPQVRLEDTYSLYGYNRDDATHPEGLDKQNIAMLSVNLRIFDNGVISKQKNSLKLQKLALQKQIEQEKLTQDINIELAISKIDTVKAQINSAKSSLNSAISAFETIAKKYEVGNVDYVTYLDALSVKTNAKAQYESALNNLQIAYAAYYYHTNKNIKDFIK